MTDKDEKALTGNPFFLALWFLPWLQPRQFLKTPFFLTNIHVNDIFIFPGPIRMCNFGHIRVPIDFFCEACGLPSLKGRESPTIRARESIYFIAQSERYNQTTNESATDASAGLVASDPVTRSQVHLFFSVKRRET